MALPDALKSIIGGEDEVRVQSDFDAFLPKNQSYEKGGDRSVNGRSGQNCRMSFKI
jgi:hypothetical protein